MLFTNIKFIDTQNGERCIITLSDERKVWACSGLYKSLKENGDLPNNIVSLGLVPSKQNPKRSYFGFEIVQGNLK